MNVMLHYLKPREKYMGPYCISTPKTTPYESRIAKTSHK
jgi:hypothetical protein